METLVMLTKIRLIAYTAFLSSVSVALSSQAATLDSHFASALAGSTGTTHYVDVTGDLEGDIHYAVFTETAYNSIFTNSTISVDPGELAYVYQVINTGTDAVSKNRIVGLNASVNGIGYSDINLGGSGEVAPSSLTAPPPVADWDFVPNILTGENSSALVLTSTNLPDGTTTDVVFNGGHVAAAAVVKPGNISIPEPASALLVAVGSSWLLIRRRRF